MTPPFLSRTALRGIMAKGGTKLQDTPSPTSPSRMPTEKCSYRRVGQAALRTHSAHHAQQEESNDTTGKGRARPAPATRTTKSYALVSQEWNTPLRDLLDEPPFINTEEDGVYMMEDGEKSSPSRVCGGQGGQEDSHCHATTL